MKGLKLKWCSYKGCQIVTHYLRSHLTHFHRMKPGALLNNHLRVAREYQGIREVHDIQHMIRARRSSSPNTTVTPTSPSTSTSTPTFTSNLPQPSTSTSTSIFNPPQPSRRNPASLPVLAPDASCQEDQESESDGEGGDSDPDYKQQGDFSYFEDPHPANDRQRWLAGFYMYLNTPDCGRKRNKNRRQHATQILKILEDLDPRGSDINILSRDEGYIVLTHWVDPNMEELSGGTIRSYLGTYEMFLNYVTMERVRPGQVPDLPGDVTLLLRTTIKNLKGWRRTVDLKTRPQWNRKRLEHCDFRLTNDDVHAFRSSSVMVNASRLLESTQQRHLTMPELCLVRDIMIAELTIQTGTRPGALANATIHDFQTVKQNQRTNMRVMLMYQQMLRYVTYVLPQFGPSRDVPNLFVISDGVTATNIRKWIVTVCHQKKKIEGAHVDEGALRLAMCHSNKTAKTFTCGRT